MKIAVIGRTQFLYNTALRLTQAGHKVEVIVTAKASPEYTKKEADFKILAKRISAAFYLTNKLDGPIIRRLRNIDIGISVNWISVIQKKHIALFKHGVLNAHIGDLPRYRGNACPNWAILNGEKEIVVSVHLMEPARLDCGRILAQAKLGLSNSIYIGDIYRWAENVIPELFIKALKLLTKNKNFKLKYADIDAQASFRCYPRRPEDSRINWNATADQIHRLIRASSKPFSGAFGYLDANKITIWRADLYSDKERYCAVPGQISEIGPDYFIVLTGQGKLKITKWESKEKIKSIRQRLV